MTLAQFQDGMMYYLRIVCPNCRRPWAIVRERHDFINLTCGDCGFLSWESCR